MATWLEDIVQALKNLGGTQSLSSIYVEAKRLHQKSNPKTADAIIRGTIETYSSDSTKFNGNNIFYSAKGIGKGVWGLHEYLVSTPKASDISEQIDTKRVITEIYRILRDTAIARDLKRLNNNRCQICGTTLKLNSGRTYSEAHHIRPLGSPHNGSDTADNILVLCPNCHVLCDMGAIQLTSNNLKIVPEHKISYMNISYHNSQIFKV